MFLIAFQSFRSGGSCRLMTEHAVDDIERPWLKVTMEGAVRHKSSAHDAAPSAGWVGGACVRVAPRTSQADIAPWV